MVVSQVTEAELKWEALRGLLRYAVLAGDVQIQGSSWEMPGAGDFKGLDTNCRMRYLDIVRALMLLQDKDSMAHELMRRDVGSHCADERCRLTKEDGGHWHKISWADLFNTYSKLVLQARFDEAREFVVRQCEDEI